MDFNNDVPDESEFTGRLLPLQSSQLFQRRTESYYNRLFFNRKRYV